MENFENSSHSLTVKYHYRIKMFRQTSPNFIRPSSTLDKPPVNPNYPLPDSKILKEFRVKIQYILKHFEISSNLNS